MGPTNVLKAAAMERRATIGKYGGASALQMRLVRAIGQHFHDRQYCVDDLPPAVSKAPAQRSRTSCAR
eukprot:4186677-Pyramimonas_sp.AAC.1